MDVSQFDFDLPEELIALRPACPRDAARLLVVRADGRFERAQVRDLPRFLTAGDCLVVNDTMVIPARLHGRRAPRPGVAGGGPKVEVTLHKRLGPDRFLAFAKPARKLAAGDPVRFGATMEAVIAARGEGGEVELVFALNGADLDAAIAREGEMPLPPYIAGKRKPDARDQSDYQTMFADAPGSVAAPTAGLHFTPELLAALTANGIAEEKVRLHVGAGTFLPVTAEDTADHKMHPEFAMLSGETAARLNALRAAGGRVVAVGTTSLRTLESAAGEDGRLHAYADETRIFITPGYRFKAVDVLLTNFHLPRSTLFMLVCAFAGTDVMKRAYAEAIAQHYRFYSYGDACLLFRPQG
jgi:S-adenosylmethionine:tRNA ribosyltransferase-isomerase